MPFLADMFHGAFDTDSRLWRSVRLLVLRPGELTAEYMRGRRRLYLGPLQVFLLANLIFFTLVATIGAFNTLTTRLRYHVTMNGYGDVAAELVERRAPAGTEERTEYEKRFDEATPRYANSMVILMVPMLALVLAVLYGGRRFFVHHLVFSLHLFAWLLLLLVGLSLGLRLLFVVLDFVIDLEAVSIALSGFNGESVIAVVMLIVIFWYTVRALQRSYGDHWGSAIPRALGLILGLAVALTVYRMLLFFIVYYRVA